MFVASKTEVWDVISENIPYLAKTLILRQKYPDAYKRLKDKWFEPENILADKDPIELRNFMINTSNISTQNAEPFIYLKKPNQAKDVVGSEKLGSLLIAGDIEGAQKIISENIKNKEKVANYILALYSQYKNRPDWMTEIFKSHLVAFDNLGITVDDAAYYNRTLEIADRYLWQSYRVFPTKIFFESIVLNDKASNPPKKNILNRYVSTLSAKEVIEDKKYALELISYLVKTGINFEDTLSAFRRYLEEAYFTETTIIKLFNTHTLQKRFVTKQAFEKFIKLLTFDNLIEWLPVIITFKQFVEENKLGNVCVETLNSIFQTEGIRGNLGDSPQKKTLVESIGNLLNTPYSVASTSESAHVGTLINNVIALYKNSNLSLEEKHYYIVPLLIARISADENIAPQIDSIIDEFIWKVTDIQIIEDNILPTLKTNKLLNDLITRYVGAIQKRAVSLGGEALGSLYQEANTNGQQSVLNAMIAQRSDLGISFIKSLKKVPDRPEAIANLLQRVTALASTDRRGVYEWITSNTKPGDGSEIKNTISTHTSDMLKGDDPSGEETGYDLFKSSINFLSETAQRDIAKSVIEWLRAPERTVSRVNRFSLKGVGLVFNSLQDPLKNDFVFVLFKLLSSSQREDLEVAIEVISEIKPKWPKYQKDFVDFKEKISTWENGDNKKYVISELNKLKSAKPSNKEKSYWKSLNELIPKDNIDKPT